MMEQKGTGPTVVRPEPSPPVAAPDAVATARTAGAAAAADAATAEEATAAADAAHATERHRRYVPARSLPWSMRKRHREINLGGNDSETNAIVTGPNVIPASVDAKYHNQEPDYPPEAARRAEAGRGDPADPCLGGGIGEQAWTSSRARASCRWTARRATR